MDYSDFGKEKTYETVKTGYQPSPDPLRTEIKIDNLLKEIYQVKMLVIDLQRELIKSGAIVLNPETETLL